MIAALLAVIVAETLLVLGAFAFHADALAAAQACARYSGRLSVAVFSIVLVAHARRGDGTDTAAAARSYLAFALAHGIHLLLLLRVLSMSGLRPALARLVPGVLAYSIIFAMPWMHRLWRRGRLAERTYRIGCRVYFAYLWAVFFLFYAPRAWGKVDRAGDQAMALVLLAWLLALGLWTLGRARRTAGRRRHLDVASS